MRRYWPYLIGIAVLALVGFFVFQTVQTGEEGRKALDDKGGQQAGEPVRFDFPPINFAAAEDSHQEFIQSAAPLDDAGQELADKILAERRELGIANALGVGRRSPWTLNQLRDRFGALVAEFQARYGPAAWARLGDVAFQEFLLALEARARVQSDMPKYPADLSPATLSGALVSVAWRDSILRLAWLADFNVVAEAEGLLGADGRLAEDRKPLAQLLFSYQWARLLSDELLLRKAMTPEELIAFRRWQIEASAAPLSRKLALIERLRGKVEHYDLDRTAAILHYQEKDFAAARDALQRALAAAREREDNTAIEEIEELLEQLEGKTNER